jgi:hypothetical protein
VTTQDKEFKLHKISSEKTFSKHEKQEEATTNPGKGWVAHHIPCCYIIRIKMPAFQHKITSHTKKQDSMAHSQNEKKLIETVLE